MSSIHIIETFIYLHHNLAYIIAWMDQSDHRWVRTYCLFFRKIFSGRLALLDIDIFLLFYYFI
jgi:hypothetical protein